jgi:hypothetical protein
MSACRARVRVYHSRALGCEVQMLPLRGNICVSNTESGCDTTLWPPAICCLKPCRSRCRACVLVRLVLCVPKPVMPVLTDILRSDNASFMSKPAAGLDVASNEVRAVSCAKHGPGFMHAASRQCNRGRAFAAGASAIRPQRERNLYRNTLRGSLARDLCCKAQVFQAAAEPTDMLATFWCCGGLVWQDLLFGRTRSDESGKPSRIRGDACVDDHNGAVSAHTMHRLYQQNVQLRQVCDTDGVCALATTMHVCLYVCMYV